MNKQCLFVVIPLKKGNHNRIKVKNYQYFVYILSSKKYGTLYIGVTDDLCKRVWQHKNHYFKGFTQKYRINKLVYYELFDDINDAIYREKCIKKWNRQWKIDLIETENPSWEDLYSQLC